LVLNTPLLWHCPVRGHFTTPAGTPVRVIEPSAIKDPHLRGLATALLERRKREGPKSALVDMGNGHQGVVEWKDIT
jgi:hypothetical protein